MVIKKEIKALIIIIIIKAILPIIQNRKIQINTKII